MNAFFELIPAAFNQSVGFDKTLRQLQEMSSSALKSVGYPPYNIVKTDENKYLIEMAVAGFGTQNIEIEMHEGKLTIRGKLDSDEKINGNFLYKGISDRAFTRTFTVADTVEVHGAELMNGMLKVFLENVIPEAKKPKKVEVVDKEKKKS